MSKLSTRVAFSILISLAVIAGIYTTVFGASPDALESQVGSHLPSGTKINLDHHREANPAPAPLQSEFQEGKGHGGCDQELQTSPDD